MTLLAAQPRTTVRLIFPRRVSEDQATAAFRALSGLLPPWPERLIIRPRVVLDAVGTPEGIAHLITVPAGRADQVFGALRAAVPGLRITTDTIDLPAPTLAREFRLSGSGRLRTDAGAASNAGLLAALQPLTGDEVVRAQFVIEPVGRGTLSRVIEAILPRGDQLDRHASPEPELAVAIRVGVHSPSRDRAGSLMARLVGALHAVGSPEARLARRLLPSALATRRIERASGPNAGAVRLAADELAALAGVPIDGPQLAGLTLAGSRELPAAAAIPRDGLVLGDSLTSDAPRPIAVSLVEARRGLHLAAPTGGGKSTILLNLAAQLVNRGEGVVLIDSKGDLASEFSDQIPPGRDDVVIFDPADQKPIGFNLIGGSGETELVVDHVVQGFRARYGAAGLGPRSEDILRACLLTLARKPGYTLCEVEPLLTYSAFRRRLVGGLEEPVLQRFWAWFEGLSDAARAEAIAPLANKLRSYTLRRRVRTVIGQADGLDFSDVLNNGRILIVSLARGLVGQDAAALLGGAMVSRLWTAIQARASIPATQRRVAFVICDEFQDFAALDLSFADAVAQSRGYGVGWVLAHQNLHQLDATTRQAVLANCRSRLVLQTTATDAAAFAREFAPLLEPSDLQGLGPYEGYAAISTGAAVAPAASLRTRPAPTPRGTASVIRQRSRERYGRSAAEVDELIRERLAAARPKAPVGGVRRSA